MPWLQPTRNHSGDCKKESWSTGQILHQNWSTDSSIVHCESKQTTSNGPGDTRGQDRYPHLCRWWRYLAYWYLVLDSSTLRKPKNWSCGHITKIEATWKGQLLEYARSFLLGETKLWNISYFAHRWWCVMLIRTYCRIQNQYYARPWISAWIHKRALERQARTESRWWQLPHKMDCIAWLGFIRTVHKKCRTPNHVDGGFEISEAVFAMGTK